ncbi:MAG: cell division protein ZapA [Faecalibacterium sp.]
MSAISGNMPGVTPKMERRRALTGPADCKSEDTMVNKVRVTIAGAPYAIATTDSEKYIMTLAKRLDEDITRLMSDNGNLSVTKAAVFCAMDYLDEYKKSAGSAENMRGQIQDYIADAARAKLAEDKAKAENEQLRREVTALREQLARMRSRADRAAAARAEAAPEQG